MSRVFKVGLVLAIIALSIGLFTLANAQTIVKLLRVEGGESGDPDYALAWVRLLSSALALTGAIPLLLLALIRLGRADLEIGSSVLGAVVSSVGSIVGAGLSVASSRVGEQEYDTNIRMYLGDYNRKIRELENKVQAISDLSSTPFDQVALEGIVRDSVAEIVQRTSIDDLIARNAQYIHDSIGLQNMRRRFELIDDNLIDYRQSNRQQYARNLQMGLLLGLSSIGVAIYLLFFGRNEAFVDPAGNFLVGRLISFYVPWITIILIIQFLAVFFLKLYRENIETERYLRDEITTVGLKVAGIEAAVKTSDDELIKRLAGDLFNSERHRTIGKDQVSLELERARIANEGYRDTISVLQSIYPATIVEKIYSGQAARDRANP